jgi:uncharacterized membrane protein YgdD (TMEM256/DUF423 family)
MQRTLVSAKSFSIHPAQLGAILALLAVALGAFGTHALADILTTARLATFETAVKYQMFHALGLLALGALPKTSHVAALPIFLGVVIFSGSLYLLIATNTPWLGAITPIGGALMIFGWGLLAWRLRNTAS